MKTSKILLTSLLVFGLMTSCKDGIVKPGFVTESKVDLESPGDERPENLEVNNWIYSQMKQFYLWEDQMPALENTDLRLSPPKYFDSILYKKGEVDRFSWIQESATELTNSLNGKVNTFGLNFSAFYADSQSSGKLLFAITYVLKGSPGEQAGLKRGDIITQIDGRDITLDNYTTVLDPPSVTLTLGSYGESGKVANKSKTLTKALITTDPLQYQTVMEMGGKKIGYFVYTQFLTDFDKSLNSMFADFKQAGIDELVVDLRFNHGGHIVSSELLSALIVKNPEGNKGKLMTHQSWNERQTKAITSQSGPEALNTYFFTERDNLGILNNPGTLNRVYFLVSGGTASASESLINNLKPYMDVYLIGTNTYGKNVGSITISDQEGRWAWGLQPIVLRLENALGQSDYGMEGGFAPDLVQDDNILPFLDFGDPNETLLNKALGMILGESTLALRGAKVKLGTEAELIEGKANFSDAAASNRYEMWLDKKPGQ